MKHVDIAGVEDVRIGKHIKVVIAANSEAEAREKIDTACKKLLINPIMENYTFSLKTGE
jgi:phosphoribosylformylglycinamidine synthase subunit PurS